MYLELKLVGRDTQEETRDIFIARDVVNYGKSVSMAYLGNFDKLEQCDPNIKAHLDDLIEHDSPELLTANVRWLAKYIPGSFKEGRGALEVEDVDLLADSIKCPLISEEAVVQYLLQPPKIELSEKMHQLLVQTNMALASTHLLSPLGLIDAVVVAAGLGKRMGSIVPKQYIKLGCYTILEHTVLKLLSSPYVAQVIVVRADTDPFFETTCLGQLDRVRTVIGGKERVDSVLQGIKAAQHEWVMVHDAARPLVSLGDIERLVLSVAVGYTQDGYAGGLLSAKIADTLKKVQNSNNNTLNKEERISSIVYEELAQQKAHNVVLENSWQVASVDQTIDRSLMYAAQTPQMFIRDTLINAIIQAQQYNFAVTDEASAMEFCGAKVMVVEGSKLNFKLTTPDDLLLLKSLVQAGISGLYVGP